MQYVLVVLMVFINQTPNFCYFFLLFGNQVPGYLAVYGMVNGLCGLFDGKQETDRQKPDGTIADTNADFAASWGITTKECEGVCPKHIQDQAWEMCSVVK